MPVNAMGIMTRGHATWGRTFARLGGGLLAASLLMLRPGPAQANLGLWTDLALGRFAKAEQTATEIIKAEKEETLLNLTPLCIARSRLKRYDTLFSCIDSLEKQLANGNGIVSAFLIPEADIRPLPGMLRAMAALELNNIPQAAELAETALALVDEKVGSTWGPLPPKGYRVELHTILGTAYALSGKTAMAHRHLKGLAELNLADTQPQKYENVRAVGLARIHMALGEYEMALQRMEKEHDLWVRGLSDLVIGAGQDSVGTIYDLPKLLLIGKAHAALGNVTAAQATLDTLLSHPRIADQGDVHWIALFERGLLAERQGARAQAMEFFLRSIEIFERQRSSLTTEASKIGFVGDKQEVYFHAIRSLAGNGQAEKAFDLVERAKARALVDMLAEKRQFVSRVGLSNETGRLLEQINQADMQSRAIVEQEEISPGSSLRALLLAQEALQAKAPELASLVTVHATPLAAVRARLQPDEILIEYYRYKDAFFVFLLDQQRLSVVTLDDKGNQLDARIGDFREALQQADDEKVKRLARVLFAQLIAPIAPQVEQKSLLLVPHGSLHYLPFAALLDAEDKWFIDHWDYRLLPSASTLLYLPESRDATTPTTLALGNPDLGMPEADLPHAEAEARAIAHQAADARLLLGRQATETLFRSISSQFQRIHFATHGEFRAEQPLQSGLLLAKDEKNDGRITVAEIYDLELNTDLITLSACETALGQIRSGDDVVGLTRGFLYAGGHSIVASLWKVADDSTAKLMEAFYRYLATNSKAEALRRAQQEVRAEYPSPFYWGAFQVMGGN